MRSIDLGINLLGTSISSTVLAMRALSYQLKRNPLAILPSRAKAIVINSSPVLWDVARVCGELSSLVNLQEGKIEVSEIRSTRVRIALKKQRIEQIKIKHQFSIAPIHMFIILERATAGMEEGRTYSYVSRPWIYYSYVEGIELVRKGSVVEVGKTLVERSGLD